MRRIALRSLLFDRPKLLAALAGVIFATTLAVVQIGLYRGFVSQASMVIERVGGDLWVMPRGVKVLDNGETMSISVRNLLESQPCVADVRAVAYGFVQIRKPGGSYDLALVVGTDERPSAPVPWGMVPPDHGVLRQPLRVTVDRHDLNKLGLPPDPIGTTFGVEGQEVVVGAVTTGIRSFTLSPYLMTSIDNARRLLGLGEQQATYFATTLADPICGPMMQQWAAGQRDLVAVPRDEWMRMTEDYWVHGSGAGLAIGFTSALGLVIGAVIVGQTLYAVLAQYRREIATLKALGARTGELAAFVLWQVGFLAIVGGAIGAVVATTIAVVADSFGLMIIVSFDTIGLAAAAVAGICALASLVSLHSLAGIAAAEVFQ
jgi:putative ABC transport system permease protein